MEQPNSDFLYFSLGVLFITLVGFYIFARYLQNEPTKDSQIDAARSRLNFAAVTITGLGIILVLAMGMYYFSGIADAGEKIFSVVSQAIVPLVTLVIGFYFGKNNDKP